jgi:hypothetical protein
MQLKGYPIKFQCNKNHELKVLNVLCGEKRTLLFKCFCSTCKASMFVAFELSFLMEACDYRFPDTSGKLTILDEQFLHSIGSTGKS